MVEMNQSLNESVYSSKKDWGWFPKTECWDDLDKSLYCRAEKIKVI